MTEARVHSSPRARLAALVAVAGLHVVVIVALVAAFGIEIVTETARSVAAFNITAGPEPVATPTPTPTPREAPARAAVAPRVSAQPARIAPRVVVKPVSAPTGRALSPGTGGDGDTPRAGGGGGSGNGDGSDGGLVRRAQKIAGELNTKDFPRSGAGERDGKFIVVRYDVTATGRVDNCRVVESSGSAEADAITCRLIEKRFRYRPAEDRQGRARPDQTGWKQWWWRPR